MPLLAFNRKDTGWRIDWQHDARVTIKDDRKAADPSAD